MAMQGPDKLSPKSLAVNILQHLIAPALDSHACGLTNWDRAASDERSELGNDRFICVMLKVRASVSCPRLIPAERSDRERAACVDLTCPDLQTSGPRHHLEWYLYHKQAPHRNEKCRSGNRLQRLDLIDNAFRPVFRLGPGNIAPKKLRPARRPRWWEILPASVVSP